MPYFFGFLTILENCIMEAVKPLILGSVWQLLNEPLIDLNPFQILNRVFGNWNRASVWKLIKMESICFIKQPKPDELKPTWNSEAERLQGSDGTFYITAFSFFP